MIFWGANRKPAGAAAGATVAPLNQPPASYADEARWPATIDAGATRSVVASAIEL